MKTLLAKGEGIREKMGISPVSLTAVALVTIGLLLGTTVHMGFLALLAAGAFGPGLLRQLGWLADLDEFQREAAAQSGLRAYLVSSVLLMAVVIAENWSVLSLSHDQVPASTVVILMFVVYYSSYCLSFWEARVAVSHVLLAFGLFWLGFVVLSHVHRPLTFLVEALVVPGPFILGAVLCRRWPRAIGLVLLVACVASVFVFRLAPIGAASSQEVWRKAFVFVLIPVPLAVGGVALLTDSWRRHETR